jgi:HEPN domain-containing protein
MNINEHMDYWLDSGEHDLETAESLFAAEQTSLALTEDQKLFLDEVNDFNVEVRYPVYRQELYKVCTKEMAEGYLTRIKEFYRWVRSQVGREKS